MTTYTNITTHFGDNVTFNSLEEMEQAIRNSGYKIPDGGLVEGRDYEVEEEDD